MPAIAATLYLVVSILTIIVYGHDKSAARRGGRRVPESLLHLLALSGGWPGGMVAQRLFHHKTKKVSFRVVFWVTVLVNAGVLRWLALKLA